MTTPQRFNLCPAAKPCDGCTNDDLRRDLAAMARNLNDNHIDTDKPHFAQVGWEAKPKPHYYGNLTPPKGK